MISNTCSSFEINWVFLVGGGGGRQNYSPFIKHLVEGPLPPAVTNLFSQAFQQLKYIGSGKCNPLKKCLKSNKVFTTQCLALKIKDRT